jgi:putative IMPACT (imprinted ancient) family translation regulator
MEEALAEMEVADSRFLGFCLGDVSSKEAILEFQQSLKTRYPDAAHIPVAWILDKDVESWNEDGEPPNSVGPGIVEEIQAQGCSGMAVAVVRYFGEQLLGVTCGRLPQCYKSIAKLTLHRYLHGPKTPMEMEIVDVDASIYGLAAGDCELILDVVTEPKQLILNTVRDELNFDGFRGASGEALPRLQNLQADRSENAIPVYRYPGNYRGNQWATFDWSPKSRKIKEAVEESLAPLVLQTMNHCVANYYRDGEDFIDHHSDKDLDLNQQGVIVSVSLGDERVIELKRRAEPRDVTRVTLPHGSMFVLGPKTNKQFTHSILRKKGSKKPRISLTLREVITYMDLKTGRLFGQGVSTDSLSDIRKVNLMENCLFFAGFSVLSAIMVSRQKVAMNTNMCLLLAGLFTTGSFSFRYLADNARKQREERAARDFFSRSSTSGTKY